MGVSVVEQLPKCACVHVYVYHVVTDPLQCGFTLQASRLQVELAMSWTLDKYFPKKNQAESQHCSEDNPGPSR